MKPEGRWVIDTNILVSALLFEFAPPAQALTKASQEGLLLLSDDLILELEEVLVRPKLEAYVSLESRTAFLRKLIQQGLHVEITETITACRDPRDNKILELAVSGGADGILTGDQDLLVLHPFRGIPILSPTDFLQRYSS